MSQKMQKKYLTKEELGNGLILIIIGGLILFGVFNWGNGVNEVREDLCERHYYNNVSSSYSIECPPKITSMYWINMSIIILCAILGCGLLVLGMKEIFWETHK